MAATLALQTHADHHDHPGTRPQTRSGRIRRTSIRRYEVARLGRIAFFVLLACTAVVIALSRAVQPAPPRPDAWTPVIVSEAATLWTLAQSHPVAGLSTAETVALIKESNALRSATIHEGQILQVPAQFDVSVAVASR